MAKAIKAATVEKTIEEQYEEIYKNAGFKKQYKTVIELNSRYIYIRIFPSYCYEKIECSVLNFINKEIAKETYDNTIGKIKKDYKNIKEDGNDVATIVHLNKNEITDLFKIKKFKNEKKKRKFIVVVKEE